MIRTLRSSLRTLRRHPGFAATATLTLALGIGLSTAVFTVAQALLLRGLPIRDQDRVLVLWGETPDRAFVNYPLNLPDARAFAERAHSLEGVAFFAYEGAWPQMIEESGRVSRLRQSLVSGTFFDLLGARPILGRALRAEDDVVGAAPVAVLSHGAWQRSFGGRADVVGQRLRLHGSGVIHSVIGVMPPGLDFPQGTDFWAPIVPARMIPGSDSTLAAVDLIGRLRADASAHAARDELTAFFRRPDASPYERDMRGVITPFSRLVLGDARPAVIAFSTACALLLLIACINVGNLLLVRGLVRSREIAVRAALGARRSHVITLLLTESAVLATAGGTLGLVTATLTVRAFIAVAPPTLPRLSEIGLNVTALGGAIAITAGALLLFGLAPAVIASRVEWRQALRSGARHGKTRGARLAAEGLVVGQIALAVLVLSAALLITRSLIKLERAELALEPGQLLIGELAYHRDQVDTREEQLALLDRLLAEVRAVPGVHAASPVVAIPFAGSGGWDGRFSADGQSAEEASSSPILNMEVVDPEYFTALGIQVLRGRALTAADHEGLPPVAVVSQSVARHYWPGDEAIGKRLHLGEHVFTVVGVVPDTRYRNLRHARPSIYFARRQSVFPYAPLTLAIRTLGPPTELVPALRHAIARVDPGIAFASAAPFDTFRDRPLAQPRLNTLLLVVFASTAVALAAIGLFGVMATLVRQRTRELGLRMALGATAASVRRSVMRRGLTIAGAGMMVGLGCAVATNRFLGSMLYDVEPTDAITLAAVVGLLLGVAAAATAIPARSTTRIDPALALRMDDD